MLAAALGLAFLQDSADLSRDSVRADLVWTHDEYVYNILAVSERLTFIWLRARLVAFVWSTIRIFAVSLLHPTPTSSPEAQDGSKEASSSTGTYHNNAARLIGIALRVEAATRGKREPWRSFLGSCISGGVVRCWRLIRLHGWPGWGRVRQRGRSVDHRYRQRWAASEHNLCTRPIEYMVWQPRADCPDDFVSAQSLQEWPLQN